MRIQTNTIRLPLVNICLVGLAKRTTCSHAADAWKLKGGFGSTGQDPSFKAWDSHDTGLHNFLKESIPEALAHTGSITFDEHLKGVQSVLRSWGSEQALSDAGLFHSIYGTEGFQGYKLPFSRRADIRSLIGSRAERLAWIFCVVDRASVDRSLYNEKENNDNVFRNALDEENEIENKNKSEISRDGWQNRKYAFTSREELGRFPILLADEGEWLDFLELTLADWLEQVEGAAEKENPLFEWAVGEAWSYRRLAYQKMADILLEKRGARLMEAKAMCDAVYAAEPEGTRGLHQFRTPPMSDAAREAREAVRSIDA